MSQKKDNNKILFLSYYVYYIFQEGLYGRTLGKSIAGTKVVNDDGAEISMGQAFHRTLCRLIPFDVLSFLGGSPSGWHDRIQNTYVISMR